MARLFECQKCILFLNLKKLLDCVDIQDNVENLNGLFRKI